MPGIVGNCGGMRRFQDRDQKAIHAGNNWQARSLVNRSASAQSRTQASGIASRSTQVHLHRNADEIGMTLCAKLLLEQRSGVGNRFVGDAERIGYFSDLVAAP